MSDNQICKQVKPEKSAAWFDALKTLPHEALKSIGLGLWEEGHYLYPREWYDFIPEGYEVVDILGDKEPFKHGETDTDQRFGFLAYGFTTDDYVPEISLNKGMQEMEVSK